MITTARKNIDYYFYLIGNFDGKKKDIQKKDIKLKKS